MSTLANTQSYFLLQQNWRKIFLILICIMATPSAFAKTKTTAPIYVINLVSNTKPVSIPRNPHKELNKYKFYLTSSVKNKTRWHRLRVGFFKSRRDARAVLKKIKPVYPDAWLTRAGKSEVSLAKKWFNGSSVPASQPAQQASDSNAQKVSDLLEKGRQAMLDEKFPFAIKIFTKILTLPAGKKLPEARELLGLAREKNGQLAHARAEYEEYLRQYSKGKDAERVRQRLLGIVTARDEPRVDLKNDKKKTTTDWRIVNSLSQFYRTENSHLDGVGDTTVDNSISSEFNSNGRYRGTTFDMRYRVDATVRNMFIPSSKPTDSRLSTAYFDISARNKGMSFRIGRQTHNSDGVLGRFDGMLLGYRFQSQWKFNYLYGYPVDLASMGTINTNRHFEGISLDIGTLAKYWNLNIFNIRQSTLNIIDRNAIGGEIKYVAKDYSTLSLIDYDIEYSVLNTAMFVGNWRFDNKASLNFTFDYRNTPPLTTTNALIGQTVLTLQELQASYNMDQIRQLARDRTLRYTTMVISGTYPLNQTFMLSGDITTSSLGASPASGGVGATPASGTDTYYSGMLTSTDLFGINDISTLNVRQTKTATVKSNIYSLTTRLPVGKTWRIKPLLRLDQQSRTNGDILNISKTNLKLDYLKNRNTKWEFELGVENTETISTATTHDKNTYFSIGYIYDF